MLRTTDVNYEKEWWRHTPLSDSIINGDWSWFNSLNMDTCLSTNIVTRRPVWGSCQHCTHATLPKAFLKEPGRRLSRGRQSMWNCEGVFNILPRFLKILLENEMWSVLLQPGRKPHWVLFRLDSIISRHLFFKALGNVNVNYFKIPKKHHGPHKRSSRATCLRPRILPFHSVLF